MNKVNFKRRFPTACMAALAALAVVGMFASPLLFLGVRNWVVFWVAVTFVVLLIGGNFSIVMWDLDDHEKMGCKGAK